MNINNLFIIADAAKKIQDYSIANAVFAVIAKAAIDNQAFGSTHSPDVEASKIHFQFETEGDDLIESLAYPNTVGYYDLPRLMKYGEPMVDINGKLDMYTLCIPLPLVSRYFCNMMVSLMDRETYNMEPAIIEREQHDRQYWRLSHDPQRVEACRRDLWRRLLVEASQEQIDEAKNLILFQHVAELPEYEPEPVEEQWRWLNPATLAKLKTAEEFEVLEEYEYTE